MAKYNYSKYSLVNKYTSRKTESMNLGSNSRNGYPSYYVDQYSGDIIMSGARQNITSNSTDASKVLYERATPTMYLKWYLVKDVTGGSDYYNMWQDTYVVEYAPGQGNYIENVVAEDGTYPVNGMWQGYWYVRGSAYVPPAPTNNPPTISVNTTDNRTLYENDTFTVGGTAVDINSGNVVNVKYQINSGTVRAITTAISSGAVIPFNKVLTFKNKALYDGSTAVTDELAEGAQHVLKVWAEDDQGGKSAEAIRIFYVIPNRPASLIINPFTPADELINSDKITVSGSVSDPDANTVAVKYKIANGSFTEVYSGSGGSFSFQVSLSALSVGANTITVQATDSYGSVTSKTLNVAKTENKQPLLMSVVRYRLTPPNGTAKGVVLWIQRETGDLAVNAEISMGATENYVPMTLDSTAFVTTGIEEDEFTFENDTAVADIIVKLTITRTSTASNEGIKLISGVLS